MKLHLIKPGVARCGLDDCQEDAAVELDDEEANGDITESFWCLGHAADIHLKLGRLIGSSGREIKPVCPHCGFKVCGVPDGLVGR